MTGRFVEALVGADMPVVMEVKRRSAGGEDLLDGRSVADVVAGYEDAGAPCVSVVTGKWFGGTEDLLHEVVGLTDRPVLWKDFVTNERRLRAGIGAGASAVLLTASLLPVPALHRLAEVCLSLGATPFVEVATAEECASVAHFAHGPDCVVAVNNKDIRRRERGPGTIDRSLSLLPAARATGTRCPVSASGIDRPEDAARLLDAGYAGLLVGTGLLRSGAGHWVAELGRLRRATG